MKKRRKKRGHKAKNIKNHARRRITQRLGFTPNREDFKKMVAMIQDGTAEFVEKSSNRVGIFRMEYNNKSFKAVYDRQRKLIITVLIDDYEEKWK